MLTNYHSSDDPAFCKQDHITMTGGGGTVHQRRNCTGQYDKKFFNPAVKLLRKSHGKERLTLEQVSADFLLPVPPVVCALGANTEVAFLYSRMKILYARHMIDGNSGQVKTQLLHEVLNNRRSPGGVSEEDENGAATSGSTHDPGIQGTTEVHTPRSYHNTIVTTAPTHKSHDRTTIHRRFVLVSCT